MAVRRTASANPTSAKSASSRPQSSSTRSTISVAASCNILPDLTPAELKLASIRAGTVLGGKGQVVTAATNRRVHILAVNHRRTAFQNLDLRKGLSLAIDRDEILNELFRVAAPQHRKFTKPMSGPFPAGFVGHGEGAGRAAGAARQSRRRRRATQALSRRPRRAGRDRIAYSTSDPQGQACARRSRAMSRVCSRMPRRKIAVILDALEPRELHRLVSASTATIWLTCPSTIRTTGIRWA